MAELTEFKSSCHFFSPEQTYDGVLSIPDQSVGGDRFLAEVRNAEFRRALEPIWTRRVFFAAKIQISSGECFRQGTAFP